MNKTVKPGLLIFYDHFFPAYKAGGPIQSLTNLVLSLQDSYNISVITGSCDLNEDEILNDIQVDIWNDVSLPKSTSSIKIWYASAPGPGIKTIKRLMSEIDPSFIYLNGMFSFRYVILPLISIRHKKIVVCPRGMLQLGALAGKTFKKKIYLSVLKKSGLLKNVSWHATNEAEKNDIIREFGYRSTIIVAGNIPKKPVERINEIIKRPGELDLVYLSLISEKKNLLQLIRIMGKVNAHISLTIYGPVKDAEYWKKCEDAIKENPNRILYKGDVLPETVQDIFSKYHASILLTKGENFGHALYESLSAGRPVITSYFTPWNELEVKKAGWNTDISNEEMIIDVINKIAKTDQIAFDEYYQAAYHLATDYFKNGIDMENYKKCFS